MPLRRKKMSIPWQIANLKISYVFFIQLATELSQIMPNFLSIIILMEKGTGHVDFHNVIRN